MLQTLKQKWHRFTKEKRKRLRQHWRKRKYTEIVTSDLSLLYNHKHFIGCISNITFKINIFTKSNHCKHT